MSIKEKIYAICVENKLLKKIYTSISYVKWKIYYKKNLVNPINEYKKSTKNPIFLIFTPEHANLGDHAIAYAESILLKKARIKYYEITGEKLYELEQYGYLSILNHATILINGGGNLGILWPLIEKMNRAVITQNPDSKIYVFPNSIFYGNDDYGRKEFELSKKIYNNHKNLHLCARERISYDIMKDAYKSVELVPDMVFTLNESHDTLERDGCLWCMRNDVERTLTDEQEGKLKQQLVDIYGDNIKESNTVLSYDVSVEKREEELKRKFNEFKSAKLIVTDRLHGMVFAAITGTNCIVINSKSPKMKGCYDWIKDLDYVAFIDDVENIDKIIDNFPDYPHEYDNKEFVKAIDKMISEIEV